MREDDDTDLRAGVWLCSAMLLAAGVVFGGASRENPLRLAAVEVASLPLLSLVVLRWRRLGTPRGAAPTLFLLAAVVAIPALQLLPLPPAVWAHLPGRAPEVAAVRVAGLGRPWLPATLASRETLAALLALTPPAAMFLGALTGRTSGQRLLAAGWIALALAGLTLGAAQLTATGPSPLYPYATTNYGSLVAFFANRNHEGAYLLALLPFAAMFAVQPARPGELAIGARWAGVLFIFLAVIGLGVVRSRAGVLLAIPTLLGCAAIVFRSAAAIPRGPRIAALAGVGLAVAAVVAFGLSPILRRFDAAALADFRFEAWPVVARAAQTFQPVGAGIGAFDRVFRAAEPLSMVGPSYFNHAHNDWLELWLEAGWAGAAVAAAFIAWFAVAAWRVWRATANGGGDLARAASLAILVLMACSVVDYPLRTETLATLFAWCCGLIASRPAGPRVAPP